jgi:hypothetical protein
MCLNDCKAENDINIIKRDVREIRDCLLGTDYTEKKGLVHKMTELETRVKTIEKNSLYRVGFAAGVGTFFGGLLGFLLKVLIR